MFKKSSFSSRLNTILAFLAVFLLILGTNRIDKRHFDIAQNALITVYKDRVLAKDYIYKINNLVHEKEDHFEDESHNISIDKQIETLLNLFSITKLTQNEVKAFESFKHNFEKIKSLEIQHYSKSDRSTESNALTKKKFYDLIDALQTDLDNLALIQVSETKNITSVAQKSLDVNSVISNMEIYSLLIIGIVIIFIVFYRIKTKP